MNWSEIIRLLGAVAVTLLLVTFSLGYFKFRIKDRLKLHKLAAFLTVAVAATHGGIVIYRKYFMNTIERLLNP